MTHSLLINRFQKILACMALCVGLALPNAPHADLVNLTQVPLANSTSTDVLPNIMFTLDNSGSMGWDFMPDWVAYQSSYSRSSNPELYRNSAWNLTYYNPAITYSPPVLFNADGTLNTTTYPSKTSGWNSVKYDAYGILSYNNQAAGTPNQLCPDGSTPSGTAPNGACDLTNGKASFYTFVAGEYCTLPNLKSCITASAPTTVGGIDYKYPATLRWCNSTALTTCQSVRTSTYSNPRYPKSATATVRVDNSTSANTVSQISVNGQNIMSAAAAGNNDESITATNIRNAINACTAAITGNCTVAGYSASVSTTTVKITAPNGTGAITFLPVVTGGATVTRTAFTGGVPGSTIYTSIVSTTTSYPYPGSSSKASTRTDCGSNTTCSYDQEMTNYANWFTYYHTRMSMMKSGVSRAFKGIDNKYRVGFNVINDTNGNPYSGATDGANFLHIDKFELAHKNSWYSKLFAANAGGSTPLRNALGKVGRIFAKKVSGQQDPMQYSCQQNFSILSTDGYWNGTTINFSLSSDSVGNWDGPGTSRPMYEGPTATSNTLADIAKYYYETDLRTSALTNCTGALGLDVCEEEIDPGPPRITQFTKQYMTSFTIGLGADGTLVYQDDYPTATFGDFNELKLGNLNWPVPGDGKGPENIDDLWHAAVNGRGEYFSAKDPDQVVKGLQKALAAMNQNRGAGAAAATSTLNPTTQDNKAFVASYTTVKWHGNLEARTIDLTTGATSETAVWCVEDVVPLASCPNPGALQNETSGASNVWYCVTPPLTATCPGATECKVEVPVSCTGTLKSKVAASSDSRTIYMKDASGAALTEFKYDNMTTNQKAYFSSPTALSQWPSLTADQQNPAKLNFVGGANLVNYLRGQTAYEDRSGNTDKLFRYREATLGDAVESQPIFIGKPRFSYTDTGYTNYKNTVAPSINKKTVFLGTNDGMLHAFDADTGVERWAYVPSMVMPKMWKLADKNYSTMHAYFVNGSAVTGDISVGTPAADGSSWRSILVGSLHGGGRGFYALDVTDPAVPKFLWEFTYTQTTDHVLKMDDNVGYSFAEPKIGKRPSDGKWVVFLTSGYNNVSPGDGKGWVYMLDPITGTVLNKVSTGAGTEDTPSGLAKVEFYADASERDNTAKFIYGGDLQGNLWRIDMKDYSLLKFAVLKDSAGAAQPITTRPELADVIANGINKRVVFAATGKYLEVSDLANTQRNTLYAIKDDDATDTFINPRSGAGANEMVQLTLNNAGTTRTITGDKVNWSTQRGWYVDFPDTGERANVDPQLEYGTLLFPTTVPTNTACAPVGYGWVNFVNFETGLSVGGLIDPTAAQKTATPVVGINLVMLPTGNVVASTVEVGDPTPRPTGVKFSNLSNAFQGKRVIWRELVP